MNNVKGAIASHITTKPENNGDIPPMWTTIHLYWVRSKSRKSTEEFSIRTLRGVHQVNFVCDGKATGEVDDMPADTCGTRFNQ